MMTPLNCMVLLGDKIAIRADEVQKIGIGIHQTAVTMTDGRVFSTDMSVAEAASAVNIALNSARKALSGSEKE